MQCWLFPKILVSEEKSFSPKWTYTGIVLLRSLHNCRHRYFSCRSNWLTFWMPWAPINTSREPKEGRREKEKEKIQHRI